MDLHVQRILFRGKGADKSAIISTGRVIGHIEIQDHLIPVQDLGIDIPSSLIGLFPVGPVLKRDEKDVTQNGFVDLKPIILPIQAEMKFPVTDITLARPFVGQKGCIIFRVIDMKDVAFDKAGEDILGIEWIVMNDLKCFFSS